VPLFAMLFKWFPDTDIAWRDVLPGAVVTALLFNLGKFLIGFYIGRTEVAARFGAAGAMEVIDDEENSDPVRTTRH
jgi:membrane protein